MKRMTLIFIFLLSIKGTAQDIGRPVIFSNRVVFTLDSTETEKVYLGFYGSRSSGQTVGFSSSSITPASLVQFTGDLELNFRIDSLSASTEYDSLSGYVLELNSEGWAKYDTLWFDFTNNTVASTRAYTSYVPFNRDTTSALPIFSINLTGKLAPSHGLEIGFIQTANDSDGTGNGLRSQVTLRSSELK